MNKNTILEAIKARDLRVKQDAKSINIAKIIKEGDSETYYPATTDDAWKLAESFLRNDQPKPAPEKKHLLTMAKKYQNSQHADFIRFYDDNGTLLIEKAPSAETEFNYGDEIFVAYFVRDFKSKEVYFPKTKDEAWTLIKKLIPQKLVEKVKIENDLVCN